MKLSEYKLAEDFLYKETSEKRHKADLILSRVSLFLADMTNLLFEDGKFVKPKSIQILRWWKISQKTITFITDIIKLIV